jgi:hypothetical protein
MGNILWSVMAATGLKIGVRVALCLLWVKGYALRASFMDCVWRVC